MKDEDDEVDALEGACSMDTAMVTGPRDAVDCC